MSLIERSVVPPILRARSATSSVIAKIWSDVLIQKQMVIAEMGSAHVPVEILRLQESAKTSASRCRRAAEISETPF